MARVIMDALSHQAIREAGCEKQAYGPAVSRAEEWAGRRLVGFRDVLAHKGAQLVLEHPTQANFDGADLFVIAGRSQLFPFSEEALEALSAFVDSGGGLLLMANHRGMILPQQQVAAAMRLPVTFVDGSVEGGRSIEILPHEVMEGVSHLVVRNSCWLTAAARAEPIALFTAEYGFGYAMAHGKGRVIALADSGFIASQDDAGRDMFAAGSNARFFDNVVDWLLPMPK